MELIPRCKSSVEASEMVDLTTSDALDIDIDLDDNDKDFDNASSLDSQTEEDLDDNDKDDLTVSGDVIGEEDPPEGLVDADEQDEQDPDHILVTHVAMLLASRTSRRK